MKRLLILIALLGTLGARSSAGEPEQATAARAIFESWQKEKAEPAERYLNIVCWTPADREFPAGHHERLSRMLLNIQEFYAREMERNGFAKRAFPLKRDAHGRVVLIDIRGNHGNGHYGKQSGHEIRQECLPLLKEAGIDIDRETIAIFCNLASWDEKELRFVHNSPYYASGTYRRGTAWQLDSPELDSLNLPKLEPKIHDGEYGHISLGKHNSIFIGGMAHELGHAFGLPHCTERPDESVRGTSLMGSGNRTYGDEIRGEGRGTFLPFAHALQLAAHPLFTGRLEEQGNRPTSELSDLQIHADGKAIVVTGKITGNPPIYGVIAYFDPEGHSDYNQTSATAIPDGEGRFELRGDALERGKRGVLHLIPLHANGDEGHDASNARMHFSYRVADDGTPDVRTPQARLALGPVVAALDRGAADEARRLATGIQDQRAAAIAAVLTNPIAPEHTPAEYHGEANRVSLTDFKPTAARVGWLHPTFNRLPGGSVLLESAGDLFATGIFAHAPARHEYALGGQWQSLTGKVGIAVGNRGSVRFEIVGDGRRLWRSPTVRPDRLVPFQVDVKGVERLELLAAPTEDGRDGDWGLWLEPELER